MRTYCGPSSKARTGANSCSIRICPFPPGASGRFRSADGSDTAVYQALVEGPLALTTVRQACLLPGVWTLGLGVFDSLPFVTELGLGEPRGRQGDADNQPRILHELRLHLRNSDPHRLSRLPAASPWRWLCLARISQTLVALLPGRRERTAGIMDVRVVGAVCAG